eukprot:7730224-Alexandrium_andersonii.AAC.1
MEPLLGPPSPESAEPVRARTSTCTRRCRRRCKRRETSTEMQRHSRAGESQKRRVAEAGADASANTDAAESAF